MYTVDYLRIRPRRIIAASETWEFWARGEWDILSVVMKLRACFGIFDSWRSAECKDGREDGNFNFFFVRGTLISAVAIGGVVLKACKLF